MKRLKLTDLSACTTTHFLQDIIPGQYLCHGGLSFKSPGQRTHDVGCVCAACDGEGRHVHIDDCEVFVILQGKAVMEINGHGYPVAAGDVLVCEAGEDHHLLSDETEPCVNIWLHASDKRHADQLK